MADEGKADLTGRCDCGAISVMCNGAPIRVSVCHCSECKRRTGSALSWNARFRKEMVKLTGKVSSWSRTGPSGATTTRHFCPLCSVILAYASDRERDAVAIPCGIFADPYILVPDRTAWAERRNLWLEITAEPMEFGH